MDDPGDQGLVGLVAGTADERGGGPVGGLAQQGRVDVALDRLEVLGAREPWPVVPPLGHGSAQLRRGGLDRQLHRVHARRS